MTEPDPHHIELNGARLPLTGEHRIALADFVRERGATSVHLGCEHGVCGACNVLVDGACTRACLMLAHGCPGASVTTLEGLTDALSDRLRAAFNRFHALQCGFCTPGMFVSAYDLLSSGEALDEARVRERLAGNICRCTGYQGIVDAILSVAGHVPASDSHDTHPGATHEHA
jgi:aerobic-type carbon monoxide dehydrogenase small subunit (CoxS/CutS family)